MGRIFLGLTVCPKICLTDSFCLGLLPSLVVLIIVISKTLSWVLSKIKVRYKHGPCHLLWFRPRGLAQWPLVYSLCAHLTALSPPNSTPRLSWVAVPASTRTSRLIHAPIATTCFFLGPNLPISLFATPFFYLFASSSR